jgi:hypothetical protein
MILFRKQVKVYKVYKRFYGYKDRIHDEFVLETMSKETAEQIAYNITRLGINKDGRIDFEGIVK